MYDLVADPAVRRRIVVRLPEHRPFRRRARIVLGILPNGEPVADQSTAMAFWMIILVLVISLAWFAALSFLTARWFEKKEVG